MNTKNIVVGVLVILLIVVAVRMLDRREPSRDSLGRNIEQGLNEAGDNIQEGLDDAGRKIEDAAD